MTRDPSRITRHGYGFVRIPHTGRDCEAFFGAVRGAAGEPSCAYSPPLPVVACLGTTPNFTPATSTLLSLGRSAESASRAILRLSGEPETPYIDKTLFVAHATFSAPSVMVKSASSAAALNDSSSERSSSTPGFAS